jgi:hypothetical protein
MVLADDLYPGLSRTRARSSNVRDAVLLYKNPGFRTAGVRRRLYSGRSGNHLEADFFDLFFGFVTG